MSDIGKNRKRVAAANSKNKKKKTKKKAQINSPEFEDMVQI